jgi:hypothetical protein
MKWHNGYPEESERDLQDQLRGTAAFAAFAAVVRARLAKRRIVEGYERHLRDVERFIAYQESFYRLV